MLASPGHSPRHIPVPPSPSPSAVSERQNALAIPSSSGRTLMGPPPAKKPRKQTVLDEDIYVAAIEKIVERDFFPDLPKLQNRLEWLEAVRSGDPALIREAQLKIIQRRAERARSTTPSIAGTPFRTPGSVMTGAASPALSLRSEDPRVLDVPTTVSGDMDGVAVDTNMPLDEFLKKYTSEDNESFSQIMKKVSKQRKQKVAHLSEEELLRPRLTEGDSRSTDGFGSSGQPESTLQSWDYKSKNLLMYDSAERPDAPLTQAELLERTAGPPKEINKGNTRFHGKVFEASREQDETIAVLYTPVNGTPSANYPFENRQAEKDRHYDLLDLRKTPQRGAPPVDYAYVATPSPRPGVGESPFMTWGDIEGTPVRLEMEDTPVNIGGSADGVHFKIPAPPLRDAHAHTMSRVAAKNIRERSRLMSPSPSPGRGASSPAVGGGLSAAAQRLVNKAIAKSNVGVDARLRQSYRGSTTPGTPGSRLRDTSLSLRSPSASPLVKKTAQI